MNRKIEISLEMPNKLSSNEIIYRLNSSSNLSTHDSQPIGDVTANKIDEQYAILKYYLLQDKEFIQCFDQYLLNLNQSYYDNLANESLKLVNKEQVKEYWTQLININKRKQNEKSNKLVENQRSSSSFSYSDEGSTTFTNNSSSTTHLLFAKMYHELIHSNSMSKVLSKEHAFMLEYNELIDERDKALQFIQQSQEASLNEKLKSTNMAYSDVYISNLVAANIEMLELEANKWKGRIDSLRNEQQRKFYKFINKLYDQEILKSPSAINAIDDEDEMDNLSRLLEPLGKKANSTNNLPAIQSKSSQAQFQSLTESVFTRLEESYTIQLGAQLKSMHNLRLIRCDIYEYCKDRFNKEQIEPHSIHTALSLYSDKLCAIIRLVDAKVDANKLKHQCRFAEICDRNGCDFHFAQYDQQLDALQKRLGEAKLDNGKLQIGDFYLTKHSNLSQAHVVFHLVAFDSDDSTNSQSMKQSDLSSRHPVILGLRNILKSCISHGIQTLTFPLLLAHEMSEVSRLFFPLLFKFMLDKFELNVNVLRMKGNDHQLGDETSRAGLEMHQRLHDRVCAMGRTRVAHTAVRLTSRASQ